MYIFYASSNKYAPYLGVSILSLFDNNQDLDTLEVFICDDGISNGNKDKLKQIAEKHQRKITFLDYKILQNAARELHWKEQGGSFCTYSKILASQFMPDYVDRVLYIDSSDTLVVGSLRDLETIDMTGYAFAARVGVSFHVQGRHLPTYDYFLAQNKTFYNCGVFLIDMKNWREKDCFKIIAQKSKNDPHFDTYDQTVINSYLPEEFGMKLPVRYNYIGFIYARHLEIQKLASGGFYSEQEVSEASDSPAIIHWPGGIHHPYVKGGLCRKKELYRKYMKMSPWNGEFDTPSVFSRLPKTNKKHLRMFYKYYPMIEFYLPWLSQLMYKSFRFFNK